jgi:hypothetical protein
VKSSRLLKTKSLSLVILLKRAFSTSYTWLQSYKRCKGVSMLGSGVLLMLQKVQNGVCPLTKCATALLKPKVLLCNLNRKTFSAFVKILSVQSLFRNFDCSPVITISRLSANFLTVCCVVSHYWIY